MNTLKTETFSKFPKSRPPLPREIEKIYSQQYKSNRVGDSTAASLSQKMESWLHKQVAKDVSGTKIHTKETLELGAGTLNQLKHEPPSKAYDIVEPFAKLYEGSPLLSNIRSIYSDISEVSNETQYDRITSIATLEHICNLPEVIAKCGLLLKETGSFRASIPSEGTMLWSLGWKLTTGLEFKLKHGLDYGLLMKHEHVNTAQEIEEVLKYFFNKVKLKVFGLSRSISLYQYFECSEPNIKACNQYLSNVKLSQ